MDLTCVTGRTRRDTRTWLTQTYHVTSASWPRPPTWLSFSLPPSSLFCWSWRPSFTGKGFIHRLWCHSSHHLSQLFLNGEGRWGTTDNFTTSSLHFPLFSTALWDLPNSRPVHSLMLSSHLFLCLLCLLPPFTVPCKMVLARPDEWKTWPYHCSLRLLRWSGGLRVVQLPAGFWHELPRL